MAGSNRLVCAVLMALTANITAAEGVSIGVGQGTQVGRYADVQTNQGVELHYDAVSWGRYAWVARLGAGYGYWRAITQLSSGTQLNSGQGDDRLHFVSLAPSLTYQPSWLSAQGWQVFARVSVAPAWVSSTTFGYHQQALHFLFSDYAMLGVAWHRRVELSWSWRHLSNGDIAFPNPGLDIPNMLTLHWRW